MSSGICRWQRPRSECTYETASIASAQSDQCLHCLLTEPLDITECMTEEQRPGWYFVHAQDDLNLRMFEGTFLLDMAQMVLVFYCMDLTWL